MLTELEDSYIILKLVVLILKWGTWICWANACGVNSITLFKGRVDLSTAAQQRGILPSKHIWVQLQPGRRGAESWIWYCAVTCHNYLGSMVFVCVKDELELECWEWGVRNNCFSQQIPDNSFAPSSVGMLTQWIICAPWATCAPGEICRSQLLALNCTVHCLCWRLGQTPRQSPSLLDPPTLSLSNPSPQSPQADEWLSECDWLRTERRTGERVTVWSWWRSRQCSVEAAPTALFVWQVAHSTS